MLPDVGVYKQGLDRVLGIDTSPPESSPAVEKFGDDADLERLQVAPAASSSILLMHRLE
jgi:hypothetical protein